MIGYRSYRNTDPPHLIEIWRNKSQLSGSVDPISISHLDEFVFAKQFFDRAGLIVATENNRPIGFIHSGFGPAASGDDLDRKVGVHCVLMVNPHDQSDKIHRELIVRAEEYLTTRGAKKLYAGASECRTPFYWGLYGGCRMIGILDSDELAQRAFSASGYQPTDHIVAYQLRLSTQRPIIDRKQVQIRRQYSVELADSSTANSWWRANLCSPFDLMQFNLVGIHDDQHVASAQFRSMEMESLLRHKPTLGLIDLHVPKQNLRQGMATFLLCQAMRDFSSQGIIQLQADASVVNVPATRMFQKLGFESFSRGTVFCKAFD